MPDLESHWLAERLAFLGQYLMARTVWKRKVEVAFLNLASNPVAESRCRPRGEALFFAKCPKALRKLFWFSDLSWPRKELYRDLMVGAASDPPKE